ncbi:MAG TPA: hypothetical protein VH501_09740 [Solirubrobacterales bacterium]
MGPQSSSEAARATVSVADAVARNRAAFEEAARGRERVLDFEVLGRTVRLRLAGDSLERDLTDALRHHALPAGASEPELEICAWDRHSTGVEPDLRGVPALGEEDPGKSLIHSPRTIVHGPNGFVTVQGTVPWAAQGFDAGRRAAFLWASEPSVLGAWGERTKPFLEILHAWLIDSPWQPIHGGAVGSPDGGVLLAGGPGAGKSTTVLSCVRAGWLYAGDDYLAVRTSDGEAFAANLYGSARLCVDMAERFSELRPAEIGAVSMNGIEKRDMILSEVLPPARFGAFPIRAILLPRIAGGSRSALRPASAAEASVAIGASTMHLLRVGASAAFEKITALAGTVPVHRLDLGEDIDALPELIGSEIGVGSE